MTTPLCLIAAAPVYSTVREYVIHSKTRNIQLSKTSDEEKLFSTNFKDDQVITRYLCQ